MYLHLRNPACEPGRLIVVSANKEEDSEPWREMYHGEVHSLAQYPLQEMAIKVV